MAPEGENFLKSLDSFRLTAPLPQDDRLFAGVSRFTRVLSVYAVAAPLAGAVGTFVVCTVLFVSPSRWITPFAVMAAIIVIAAWTLRLLRKSAMSNAIRDRDYDYSHRVSEQLDSLANPDAAPRRKMAS
jgi:hypothetical protein